jgi:ubiquinone/menaquinone biosynthesis C-methylase UbiE
VEWGEELCSEVIAPLAATVDLGAEVLELGPGPGAATRWLSLRAKKLTCVESDLAAASRLAERFAGSNVEVVVGSAAAMNFDDESFDSVCCFTMLHHIPTNREQNALIFESLRVLRPGGVFIGSDSLASDGLHHFHVDDTYNPVDPSTFLTRLQTLGFHRVTLIVDQDLRFIAFKPDRDSNDNVVCAVSAAVDGEGS